MKPMQASLWTRVGLWRRSTSRLLPRSTSPFLLLCLSCCLYACVRWKHPPSSFSTPLLTLCLESCLESSHQSPCLPYFIFGDQRGIPLHLVVRYAIGIFLANNIIDFPFLLIICHFYHLLRHSRAIWFRYHQSTFGKSSNLAIYSYYQLLRCCSRQSRRYVRIMRPVICKTLGGTYDVAIFFRPTIYKVVTF